jgi:hypothetical protein
MSPHNRRVKRPITIVQTSLRLPAALRLQQTFDSWPDLESDFLIGREYWSDEQTQQTGDKFQSNYERFTADHSSPWNQNPWTRDLGVATPLSLVKN